MTVRPGAPSEIPQLADLAARAFHDDPLFAHLYPDASRRDRAFAIEHAAYMRTIYQPCGIVDVAADHVPLGVALWLPPGGSDGLRWRELACMPSLVRAVGVRRALAFAREYAAFDAVFPSEPCWYLGLLAVAPVAQGRGIGGTLLRAGLDRADRDGTGAFLETGTEANIRFYERHGFRVNGELHLPTAPMHWTMWRDPLPVHAEETVSA